MQWMLLIAIVFLKLNGFADTLKVDILKLLKCENDLKWSFNPSISASFNSYKNWLNINKTSISILHGMEFRIRRNYLSGWSSNHHFRSELGYINYPDSVWIKSSDNFKLTLQWNEKQGRVLTHTYSFFIKSQLLNTFKYRFVNDTMQLKELTGWIMAPGTIEVAYGFNKRFWDESGMNIAFATCRFDFKPDSDKSRNDEDELLRFDKSVVYSEYGFSAQLYIKQEFFNKVILWDHQGRYFYKALNKKGVHADVSNRITVKFLKYMQLRLDSQFIYDPDISRKGSYKNEFLLGLFLDLSQ